MAPDWRSPSRFPGSKKAMLIKNPGPVKSHSFFHEKGGTVESSTVSNSNSATRIFSPASYATSSSNDNDDAAPASSRSRFASSSLSSSFDPSSRDGALILIKLSGVRGRRRKPVRGGLLRVHTQHAYLYGSIYHLA